VKRKRWLYIPVEIAVRELDAKLLLSIHAAHSGYNVVLGTKAVLKALGGFPAGAILYKSSHPDFAGFRALGHRIVVHDEEGLVRLSEAESYGRAATESLKFADLYLCWGESQRAIVEKAACENAFTFHVAAVGHPRIDLLNPRFRQVDQGPRDTARILINTKLAEYNHVGGYDGWLDILVQTRVVRTADDLSFRKRQRDYKERLFRSYLDLVLYLSSEFPECEIMLRPHPAENVTVWKHLCSDCSNIVVANTDSVVHWIKRSDVAIHTACTTGIESALLGRTTISYHPEETSEFRSPLPDAVSRIAHSPQQVAALVRNALADAATADPDTTGSLAPVRARLSDHISNIEGGDSYAAIVSEIDQLPLRESRISLARSVVLYSRMVARRVAQAVGATRDTPPFSTHEITRRVREIEACYPGHGREVKVQQLDAAIFLISAPDNA
jgi:surface carbohydrate biosynthesis protein